MRIEVCCKNIWQEIQKKFMRKRREEKRVQLTKESATQNVGADTKETGIF